MSNDPETLKAFVDQRLPELQETCRRMTTRHEETGTFLLADIEEMAQGIVDVFGGTMQRLLLLSSPEDAQEIIKRLTTHRGPKEHRPDAFKAMGEERSEAPIVAWSNVCIYQPTWMR